MATHQREDEGFVVNRVALMESFSKYFGFIRQFSFHVLICHAIFAAMQFPS
jgi:hypothetical protein